MTRKESPIDEPLWELFGRLNLHAGLLTLVASDLRGSAEDLSVELTANPEVRFVKGFGLFVSVSDISLWPPGLERRHYATGGFEVLDETYVDAMGKAIARESGWAVSQAYEAFETFLLDIAAFFLHANQSRADSSAIKRFGKKKASYGLARPNRGFWTIFVREQYRSRQNRRILSLLRKLGPSCGTWERKNARKVHLDEWYEVTSEVRHAVTHTDQVIAADRTSSWSPARKRLLGMSYPCTNELEGHRLVLTAQNAHDALERFAEYAFLIFKALCVEADYDWDIFGNLAATSSAYPPGH